MRRGLVLRLGSPVNDLRWMILIIIIVRVYVRMLSPLRLLLLLLLVLLLLLLVELLSQGTVESDS